MLPSMPSKGTDEIRKPTNHLLLSFYRAGFGMTRFYGYQAVTKNR
jgi:hypothetical protein